MNIPVVDLAAFTNGDDAAKQAFVQQLGTAYEQVGFVAVKNHGISDELIANLYAQVQQFFAMTTADKKKIRNCRTSWSTWLYFFWQRTC